MATMRINVNKGLRNIILNPVLLLTVFMSMLLIFGCATTQEGMDASEFNDRGIAYHQKGQYDQAISAFNKALEIDPRHAESYNNRGIARFQKGQYDRAISDFSKVLEINPKDADTYYNRGIIYFQKGQYIKAVSDFNKVLEIDPKHEKASYNQRLAYAKGQLEKAISELNEKIDKLKKENQRIRDKSQNKMAMMRDQNALLNQQIDKLKEENQKIRDKNKVLAEKPAKLQLKHKPLLSKSYELKKQEYKTKLLYVQGSSVRVRSGPGTNYRVIGSSRLGDKIFTREVKGDWYRIVDRKDSTKIKGWMHRSLLGKMPPGK